MGSDLKYITSEPSPPNDEYAHVLDVVFKLKVDQGHGIFARLGVKNALASLHTHVYPVPAMADFVWFLKHTRPIGISDGVDIICVAENFSLDSFTRFDWITAEFSPAVQLSAEARDDFLGFVTCLTLYKCLRYNWDHYD